MNALLLFEVGQAIRGFDAETQLLPQVDLARILAQVAQQGAVSNLSIIYRICSSFF